MDNRVCLQKQNISALLTLSVNRCCCCFFFFFFFLSFFLFIPNEFRMKKKNCIHSRILLNASFKVQI